MAHPRSDRVLACSVLILLVPFGVGLAQTARLRPPLRAQSLGVDLAPSLPWTLNVIGSPDLQAFLVSESRQGEDRNGDGDLADHVWSVFDPCSGRMRNLGLASSPTMDHNLRPRVVGRRLAFLVSEQSQGGTDLSGDGTTDYFALHLYDAARDQVFNLQSQGPFFELSGALLVHAHGTVPGQSNEVRVVDLASGASATIATHASYRVACSDRWVAYTRLESGAGDLNLDGDATDHVVHVYDHTTGVSTMLGIAMTPSDVTDRSLRVVGGTVSFLADEAAGGGGDLSGDGVANDFVPCAYAAESGSLHIFPYATFPVPMNGIESSSYRLLAADVMMFGTAETTGDLNGDGDTLDNLLVLQPLDGPAFHVASSIPFAWDALRGRLALPVREPSQGGVDRNGDGDAFDDVLHLYEPASGNLTNLGLGSGQVSIGSDGTLAFEVWEPGQGGIDLSGDGDTMDHVWFVRTPGGRITNTGLVGHAVPSGSGVFLFDAFESLTNVDLNSDGDAADRVLVRVDARTGTQFVLRQPISGIGPEGSIHTLLGVSEAVAGDDLNGDGDTNDQVLHRLGL